MARALGTITMIKHYCLAKVKSIEEDIRSIGGVQEWKSEWETLQWWANSAEPIYILLIVNVYLVVNTREKHDRAIEFPHGTTYKAGAVDASQSRLTWPGI